MTRHSLRFGNVQGSYIMLDLANPVAPAATFQVSDFCSLGDRCSGDLNIWGDVGQKRGTRTQSGRGL